jgi:hypothetical protein
MERTAQWGLHNTYSSQNVKTDELKNDEMDGHAET